MIFCSKHKVGSALVQNRKINCLTTLWRCQPLHWNWYYLYLPSENIQFPKFYYWKSNDSLDHWEDDVYLRDFFLSNWFFLAHFHEGIQWKSPKFSGTFPQTPPELWPGPAGWLTAPPRNSQLIIAIAARLFSQNSIKNWPPNFSLFRPL